MSKKEKLVVEHFVVIDVKQLDDLILENSKLKQQLAEKTAKLEFANKEIERLNNILNIEIPAILKKTRDMLNERFIWKNIE